MRKTALLRLLVVGCTVLATLAAYQAVTQLTFPQPAFTVQAAASLSCSGNNLVLTSTTARFG